MTKPNPGGSVHPGPIADDRQMGRVASLDIIPIVEHQSFLAAQDGYLATRLDARLEVGPFGYMDPPEIISHHSDRVSLSRAKR